MRPDDSSSIEQNKAEWSKFRLLFARILETLEKHYFSMFLMFCEIFTRNLDGISQL